MLSEHVYITIRFSFCHLENQEVEKFSMSKFNTCFQFNTFLRMQLNISDLGINITKSPPPHVFEHSNRSTRDTAFPLDFANYICLEDNL